MVCRRQRTHYGPPNEAGVALVIVLWVTALLGVMALSFAKTARIETALADQLVAAAQTRAAAEAAIQRGILEMLDPRPNKKKRYDGRKYRWRFAGVDVWYSVQDESGLVDLNEAQPDVLNQLLRWAGVEESNRATLVDAIIDWRDEDSARGPNGAEDPEYEAVGKTYSAKDGPFNTIEELNLVLGMTPAIYKRIERTLTVHAHTQQVNAQVAPKPVRAALGLKLKLDDGNPDLTTDAQQLADLNDALAAADDNDPDLLGGITSGVNLATIKAQGRINGRTGPVIAATIKIGGADNLPFTIIAWKEGGGGIIGPYGEDSADKPRK